MIVKTFKGQTLPALGFGTWRLYGDQAVSTVRFALDVGYRMIDTAARYDNEAEVGRALRESGIDRADVFLTTKLRYGDLDPDRIEHVTRESLARLGVDHVDLLLPHWPSKTVANADIIRALVRMRDKGLTRHVGLSNFTTALLREVTDAVGDILLTDQVEYHPYLSQDRLLGALRSHDMALTAAVPLARGLIDQDPVLREIAEAHGKTPSQVTLRWLIQQDNVIAIPKSAQPERVRANFEIFDFALSEAEMARINRGRGERRLVNMDYSPVWDVDA